MNAVREPSDAVQVPKIQHPQHCKYLEPGACTGAQPSTRASAHRQAFSDESGHPSHQPALGQLFRRAKVTAFTRFMLDNQSMVYTLAYRILGDPGLAASATEKTFLRAFPAFGRHRKSPKLWVISIVVATCQEQLCHLPRHDSGTCDLLLGDRPRTSNANPAGHPLLCDDAQVFLDVLPLDQRIPLVLSDIQGLRYREIAKVTGVPVTRVRSWLTRARMSLRDALRTQGKLLPEAGP